MPQGLRHAISTLSPLLARFGGSPAQTTEDHVRVLVTGGAGFIGSAIVDLLVDRGDEVLVVDRLHPVSHRTAPDYLNPGADYRVANLADAAVAAAATEGVDAVCHQAAMVGLGVDF